MIASWKKNSKNKHVSSLHIFFLSFVKNQDNATLAFESHLMKQFNNEKSIKVAAAEMLKAMNDYKSGLDFLHATDAYSSLCKKLSHLLYDFGINYSEFQIGLDSSLESKLVTHCNRIIYRK